ncbi:MAG TPA: DUF2585 family protein [Allosphingosinicella sp.]|jgi:hypothetical protein|uniref:DUF2585 family protein n=1 Tax=Allosphingosinicella sp. TaxID=2823234 RepID=UPI002F2A19C8
MVALALLTAWLLVLGRPLVCPCGVVRLWAPAQDSQQLADWYSLLHVTFGLGLFTLVRRFQPRWPLALVTLVAVIGSVAGEAVENLPALIALFNPPGESRSYAGDTVLNAIAGTLSVVAGCLIAARTSTRAALLMAILIEIIVWAAIGDGLIVGSARLLLAP